MIPPSASTPSAAIRTKRVAGSLPLPVHDDDREDDFVAKMYFTDDIDGGIELDWCLMEGEDIKMERWNSRKMSLAQRRERRKHYSFVLRLGIHFLYPCVIIYFLYLKHFVICDFYFKSKTLEISWQNNCWNNLRTDRFTR